MVQVEALSSVYDLIGVLIIVALSPEHVHAFISSCALDVAIFEVRDIHFSIQGEQNAHSHALASEFRVLFIILVTTDKATAIGHFDGDDAINGLLDVDESALLIGGRDADLVADTNPATFLFLEFP